MTPGGPGSLLPAASIKLTSDRREVGTLFGEAASVHGPP